MENTHTNCGESSEDNNAFFIDSDSAVIQADSSSKQKNDIHFSEIERKKLRIPMAVLPLIIFQPLNIAPQIINVIFSYIHFKHLYPFSFYIMPTVSFITFGVLIVLFLQRRYNKAPLLLYTGYSILVFIVSLLSGTASVWSLLYFASRAIIIAFTVPFLIKSKPHLKRVSTKLWFLPALIYGAVSILSNASGLIVGVSDTSVDIPTLIFAVTSNLLGIALPVLAIISIMKWLIDPINKNYNEYNNSASDEYIVTGYVGLIKCILLLLFTFGIYPCYWLYRTTRFLNCVSSRERNPLITMLLCIFVPFYLLYWIVIHCRLINTLARSKGVLSDITVPCVILSIFTYWFFTPIIMQQKINRVSSVISEFKANANVPSQTHTASTNPEA